MQVNANPNQNFDPGIPKIRVQYLDYLGFLRNGHIIYMMEANDNLPEDERYCLIQDEEDDVNTHEININGTIVKYAEIRRSGDCVRIPERSKWSDEVI